MGHVSLNVQILSLFPQGTCSLLSLDERVPRDDVLLSLLSVCFITRLHISMPRQANTCRDLHSIALNIDELHI
jgi:hypothetical protein